VSGSDTPQKVEGLTGTVTRGPFARGTKSERDAIWLETGDRRLVLRRKSGPAFDDRALEKYVGKRVRCDGFIVGYTLLAERIDIVR
jgi:hypothetical protein